MQFASRQIRDSLAQTGTHSLTALKQSSKEKYQQTLNFMQEWTEDLMERENQLQQQSDQLMPTNSSNNNHNDHPVEPSSLNV